MHSILKPYIISPESPEECGFFSLHHADRRALDAYLRHVLEGAEAEYYREAALFALDERHEEHGNERLACRLLAAILFRGIGIEEAKDYLERLESRQSENRVLASSLDDACYGSYDDSELQENIDLLKKALKRT